MVTIAGMKLRSFIALVVGCCLFVAEGINYSQLAPFFPTEAETKKGLDEFHVGIVNSSFDIATIFFTAVLAVVATPELNKFFFLWGAFIGAVALICFGVLALGPGEIFSTLFHNKPGKDPNWRRPEDQNVRGDSLFLKNCGFWTQILV